MKFVNWLFNAVMPACYVFAVVSLIFCLYMGVAVVIDLM